MVELLRLAAFASYGVQCLVVVVVVVVVAAALVPVLVASPPGVWKSNQSTFVDHEALARFPHESWCCFSRLFAFADDAYCTALSQMNRPTHYMMSADHYGSEVLNNNVSGL